jgi:hypothetical protein
MKKRLVSTLCSAVIALSSLTSITAQASGEFTIITPYGVETYNASENTTATDTTATTDTVVTPNWGNFENLHIYGKSFSGTLLDTYVVFPSYITNISSNFTVTATDLYNDTADGYTLVKVTATRTPNETRYGKTSYGKITTDVQGGVVRSCSSYRLIDSLGYQVVSSSSEQAYYYIKSISEVGDYSYSSQTWNKAKYFLEPYGYTYEYLKALAAQIFTKDSEEYLNYRTEYPYSILTYDGWLNYKVEELINSALKDIYGTDHVSYYMSSLGNCVFELSPSDSYDTYYAIPSSEKFYYAFCNSTKLTTEPDSYNSTHLITLN